MILRTISLLTLFCTSAIAQQLPSDFDTPEDCGLYRYKAKIIRVYDGDTVWADIDLGFNTWRRNEPLRLWGIDTPELKLEERAQGLKVRDVLRERIGGKEVIVCTIKGRGDNEEQGKYGRYLAIIWDGTVNVNDWLLQEGHAVPYK